MWELDYKESWAPKNWCFWTVVWRRLLRVPWTARRSNQSILKEISPEYSLEGLMLKLKLQYFGHWCKEQLICKDPVAGKDWRQEEKGTEDETVGWHRRLDGLEFEQAPAIGDGHRCLECCRPWDHKESETTEWLNWTELKHWVLPFCSSKIALQSKNQTAPESIFLVKLFTFGIICHIFLVNRLNLRTHPWSINRKRVKCCP